MTTAHLPPGPTQATDARETAPPAVGSGLWSRVSGGRNAGRRPAATRPHAEDEPPSPARTAEFDELWHRHGGSVYTLACALLDDEAAAAQAVRLGLSDLARATGDPGKDAHRRWASHVYVRSQELAGESGTRAHPSSTQRWPGHLAQLPRACLALCLFGGHTYREVASLLDLPPGAVADLLRVGLSGGAAGVPA